MGKEEYCIFFEGEGGVGGGEAEDSKKADENFCLEEDFVLVLNSLYEIKL